MDKTPSLTSNGLRSKEIVPRTDFQYLLRSFVADKSNDLEKPFWLCQVLKTKDNYKSIVISLHVQWYSPYKNGDVVTGRYLPATKRVDGRAKKRKIIQWTDEVSADSAILNFDGLTNSGYIHVASWKI